MCMALAVAAAEALNCTCFVSFEEDLCPSMLKLFCIVANPSGLRTHIFPQVIDVPMFELFHAQVTQYARLHTTRAEGATHIDVIPPLDVDLAPTTNLNINFRMTLEDEGVCSRL